MLEFERAIWISRLDGLDVSIDAVDTQSAILNYLDIFAQRMFVLLSLLQLWE